MMNQEKIFVLYSSKYGICKDHHTVTCLIFYSHTTLYFFLYYHLTRTQLKEVTMLERFFSELFAEK
jgi:hypothetical protein